MSQPHLRGERDWNPDRRPGRFRGRVEHTFKALEDEETKVEIARE